jgi:MFS family permease
MAQLVNFGGLATLHKRRPGITLAVILTAQMMVVLDATIVNVALPHIQHSLGFSSSSLSWVLNSYVLTFGGLLLLGARSGDLLGRRRTFLAGITLFSLSSLAGGLATASWMLLAARSLQGVGGALAAPAALALLTNTFPEGSARVRAIGLFTTVSAAGGATGLVAGGLITEWASWRWVMFVNVPIGIAVALLGCAVLGETERRHGRFDLAGALTSTAGMSAVVLGLVHAGTNGWSDPTTVVCLAAGVLLLGAFVRVEATAEEPILPLRILVERTRASANLARGFGYAGMYGSIFFLTQFFQEIQGHSSLVTGLGFLPTPITVFLTSQLTSKVLVGRVPTKALMVVGSALSAGGPVPAVPADRRHQLRPGRPQPDPHRSRHGHLVRQPDHRRLAGCGAGGLGCGIRSHQRHAAARSRPRPRRPGHRVRHRHLFGPDRRPARHGCRVRGRRLLLTRGDGDRHLRRPLAGARHGDRPPPGQGRARAGGLNSAIPCTGAAPARAARYLNLQN